MATRHGIRPLKRHKLAHEHNKLHYDYCTGPNAVHLDRVNPKWLSLSPNCRAKKGRKNYSFWPGLTVKTCVVNFQLIQRITGQTHTKLTSINAYTHTHTNTYTQKKPCNSGFLVCPVLFLFFWQYLLCLFIFQCLQQEHGGFVITVSELLYQIQLK